MPMIMYLDWGGFPLRHDTIGRNMQNGNNMLWTPYWAQRGRQHTCREEQVAREKPCSELWLCNDAISQGSRLWETSKKSTSKGPLCFPFPSLCRKNMVASKLVTLLGAPCPERTPLLQGEGRHGPIHSDFHPPLHGLQSKGGKSHLLPHSEHTERKWSFLRGMTHAHG